MSHFLERLTYLSRRRESFADGHGELRDEDRMWEEGYRQRWQHDKIVRSTHGVNCTGSCSWKIYVKSGVVTWETQQTDYPRTRPGMPNHEPRGCSRGASYSWYLYSASRIKYPMVRGRLVKAWREARKTLGPVEAWAAITADEKTTKAYKAIRGRGGFVRSTWSEATEMIAAANVHTIRKWGPDRVVGFSPIPAMSMVSYASGARYLSLIGGTLLSFYDWYCDLPPSSPQTWGEQTDVPESADWYNSGYIIAWGSNVPQTRTPDAHFFTEARYNGTNVVAVTPDYSEVAKLSDLWLHPKQGTDAALAMAMGHVVLKEFFLDRKTPYFEDYCRRLTDLPMLVRLKKDGDRFVPDRYPRLLDKLFASRAVVEPEDADFFGAFAVDPARPAEELEMAYAPGLTETERKLTVGALVVERLGGHAEYADRVSLGTIELIVRDVDDKGHVTGLGLSFEPTAPVARVPVFLSAGEIADRIAAFARKLRKSKVAGPSNETHAPAANQQNLSQDA